MYRQTKTNKDMATKFKRKRIFNKSYNKGFRVEIWENKNSYYGKLYQHGELISSASFNAVDGDMSIFRVLEYFNMI